MTKEKSKIDQLNAHIDSRVEERANEKLDSLETKLMDKFSVHTESRTSKWVDYQPGVGEAFNAYVESALRSVQKTGKIQNDLTSYAPDKEYAKRFLERAAPMGYSTDGGQNVLEQPLHQEIIQLLRRELILDKLGVTFIPMTSRTLDLPTETSKATFKYTNESATIDESQYDFGQKQLVAKKLAGRVGITNDFLAMNPLASSQWVANRMIADYARKLEASVIEGVPGGPESLFDGVAAGNKFELTATPQQATDLDEYLEKVDDAVESVCDQNVRESDIKILTNIRHRNFLRRQRGAGGYVFPEVRDKELQGYPLMTSADIGNGYDDSGDGDSDETRIFVGDFSAYYLGVLQEARLDFSEDSRFAKDEGEFRLVGHNDGILTRPDQLAVVSTDISS